MRAGVSVTGRAIWAVALTGAWVQLAAAGAEPALVRAEEPGWPQWRGPRRDGVSEERGLLQSWPAGGPRLLWRADGLGRGYSSPVVSGQAVFVTGDTNDTLRITALTADGRRRWQVANGAAWKRNFPGARASCAYQGGKVYHLNAFGDLVCLDAADGATRWRVNLLERYAATNINWGISESVLVHGGRVFATPAGGKGLMVALDAASGAPVWATPGIEGEQAGYGAAILLEEGARKVLVNCTSAHTFGVDAATGALLWRVPHVDVKNTVNVTPMLYGRRLYVTNTSRDYGAVYGLDADGASAGRAWLRELKISHGGMLCVGGRLYGASSKGERKGWVSLLAETGELTAAAPDEGLPEGSAIYADGRFYVLGARGVMTLQEAVEGVFREAGSFAWLDAKVQDAWAHPVLCDGRLYLRYHDTLYCYDVRR